MGDSIFLLGENSCTLHGMFGHHFCGVVKIAHTILLFPKVSISDAIQSDPTGAWLGTLLECLELQVF